MEILKVQSVNISPESLGEAIKALDEAIDQHTQIKEHLERILALQRGRGRRRGRPPKASVARQGGRGRRPPGEMTLRQAILAVLSRVKGPLKPVELRNKVLDSGYKTTATLQSIYTAVFNTARKEPSIAKTKAGFRLKAGANHAGVARRKTRRKKASKRAAAGKRGRGRPRARKAKKTAGKKRSRKR